MEQDVHKKKKILDYSIVICCCLLFILVGLVVSNEGVGLIMGNSVYDNNSTYQIGDIIEYAGDNWYVIEENKKSYTLLKQHSLTKDEITSLNLNLNVSDDGQIVYDYAINCHQDNDSGCNTNLTDSVIGQVLTAWQSSHLNMDELVTIDDYTIRLINLDDINRLKDYDWLYLDNYYWTMSAPNYSGVNVYGLYSNHLTYIQMVYDGSNDMDGGLVRPVINVNKKAFR